MEWFRELRNSDLGGPDFRVLFFLCENMKQEDNIAYLKQKEIASRLHMDRGNVSKCIKRLYSVQFIAKCENGFMINPHLFSVGHTYRPNREDLREKFNDLLNTAPFYEVNEDEFILEVHTNDENDEV
ncbi:MarR family transcriptional regulator [Rossellomorea aquimaris]|uniref:MarR family transcriptional regulator n=1 Tax=Rossellomorea aquimaris TaxID=189382 RepID=UPI001CD1BF30|nr:helix-turn-helix domain-containing protein [Rossellomorea aquimaris]MCA1060294.1 MarR family transcriptional regulator [Rossellomorea aquimaris]